MLYELSSKSYSVSWFFRRRFSLRFCRLTRVRPVKIGGFWSSWLATDCLSESWPIDPLLSRAFRRAAHALTPARGGDGVRLHEDGGPLSAVDGDEIVVGAERRWPRC